MLSFQMQLEAMKNPLLAMNPQIYSMSPEISQLMNLQLMYLEQMKMTNYLRLNGLQMDANLNINSIANSAISKT